MSFLKGIPIPILLQRDSYPFSQLLKGNTIYPCIQGFFMRKMIGKYRDTGLCCFKGTMSLFEGLCKGFASFFQAVLRETLETYRALWHMDLSFCKVLFFRASLKRFHRENVYDTFSLVP